MPAPVPGGINPGIACTVGSRRPHKHAAGSCEGGSDGGLMALQSLAAALFLPETNSAGKPQAATSGPGSPRFAGFRLAPHVAQRAHILPPGAVKRQPPPPRPPPPPWRPVSPPIPQPSPESTPQNCKCGGMAAPPCTSAGWQRSASSRASWPSAADIWSITPQGAPAAGGWGWVWGVAWVGGVCVCVCESERLAIG